MKFIYIGESPICNFQKPENYKKFMFVKINYFLRQHSYILGLYMKHFVTARNEMTWQSDF